MIHLKSNNEDVQVTIQHSPVFEIIKCQKEFDDYGILDVFGIKAYWEENPDSFYQLVDISTNKDVVEQLIEVLISHLASPITCGILWRIISHFLFKKKKGPEILRVLLF